MKIYPRLRVNIIALLLIALFLRLSYWQWERHIFKKVYLHSLLERLAEPPTPLHLLLEEHTGLLEPLLHRRVYLSGTYDFNREMILRNRRYDEQPGFHVLTPLHLQDIDRWILVDRGFAPYQFMKDEFRQQFDRPSTVNTIVLLKEPVSYSVFSPADPTPGDIQPWIGAWLRIDLQKISKQMPYPLFPLYAELIPGGEHTDLAKAVIETRDNKAEIFMPKDKIYGLVATKVDTPPAHFPIPRVEATLPPSRHLGYVFEWAALAMFTAGIALIIQLKPPRKPI